MGRCSPPAGFVVHELSSAARGIRADLALASAGSVWGSGSGRAEWSRCDWRQCCCRCLPFDLLERSSESHCPARIGSVGHVARGRTPRDPVAEGGAGHLTPAAAGGRGSRSRRAMATAVRSAMPPTSTVTAMRTR